MIALLALMTALLGSLLLAAQPAAASAAISATGSTAASSYAYDGFLHLSQPAQLPPLSVSLDRDAEAKTRPSSVGQADRVAGAVRLTSAHAYV
ncbi:MAG: hypothetical protein LH630_05825 [Actinomycetia bacterium]|nr:hypothetical protein [Actinomycetes bacterium]